MLVYQRVAIAKHNYSTRLQAAGRIESVLNMWFPV